MWNLWLQKKVWQNFFSPPSGIRDKHPGSATLTTRIQTGERPFVCSLCKKNLNQYRTCSDIWKLICSVCVVCTKVTCANIIPVRPLWPRLLSRAISRVTEVQFTKPYRSLQCPKSFTTSCNLKFIWELTLVRFPTTALIVISHFPRSVPCGIIPWWLIWEFTLVVIFTAVYRVQDHSKKLTYKDTWKYIL